MGEVIKMPQKRRQDKWRQLFVHDGEASVLQFYVNDVTKELEVVQYNDDNEAIRTCLGTADAEILFDAFKRMASK